MTLSARNAVRRDPRRTLALARDASVYCCLGCGARTPRAENAAIHASPEAAGRAGVVAETVRFALGRCSLGALLVAGTARGVCAIFLGDEPAALQRELERAFPRAELVGAERGCEQWVAQVAGLVEAPARGMGLPLDIRGSMFRQRVWQALRQIPPGTTQSYAELARRIGAPAAVRAVAGACAANLLAVAIPCHRVVRSDGALAGYRWGLARKHALLAREARPQDAGAAGGAGA